MIKVSEEIEKELEKKYPNTDIKNIIENLFKCIIEKTLKDGSCNIREFGKFTSFKTYSKKLECDVVRMKFRLSNSIENKIKKDKYLLGIVAAKAKVPFTEEHQAKCNNDVKLANVQANLDASKIGKQVKKDREMNNLILDILESDFED